MKEVKGGGSQLPIFARAVQQDHSRARTLQLPQTLGRAEFGHRLGCAMVHFDGRLNETSHDQQASENRAYATQSGRLLQQIIQSEGKNEIQARNNREDITNGSEVKQE